MLRDLYQRLIIQIRGKSKDMLPKICKTIPNPRILCQL